jgi:hypothetical protein
VTKQTIVVEHIHIESAKSFADVRAALESSVPHLDPSLVKALADGDVERADRAKEHGPELSIFQVRDHGARSRAKRVMRSNTISAILSRPRL